MALSHEEQRRLEELEALLAQDDPKLAHTLRGTRHRPFTGRRAMTSGAGFLLGIGLLVAGMQWHWTISVLGFLVMLAAAVHLVGERPGAPAEAGASSGGGSRRRGRTGRPSSGRPSAPASGEFMDRLEDRWRRRQRGEL